MYQTYPGQWTSGSTVVKRPDFLPVTADRIFQFWQVRDRQACVNSLRGQRGVVDVTLLENGNINVSLLCVGSRSPDIPVDLSSCMTPYITSAPQRAGKEDYQ